MKGGNTSKYWTKWATLSGKQKALLYNPGNMLKRKAILNYILHKSQYIETPRILDVGGGLGDLAFEFYQTSPKNQGEFLILDIDSNALVEAKSTLQYFTCEFLQADAQKLPFKPETFDIVICSDVLEHLPNDSIAIKEMVKVLKDDGTMIVTIPYMERELGGGHLRRYDLESFNRLCKMMHLDIQDISFCCRSIHVVRYILRKLYKREGMGERESALYSRAPLMSKFFVSILKPIDNALANKPEFSKHLKFLNEATLVACLMKKKEVNEIFD